MAEIRNSKNIEATFDKAALALIGVAANSTSLRHSATQGFIAPTSFSGCLSELSSGAIRNCDHDYAAAMKSYGVVYEEYQSYLMPAAQTVAHDYDMAARSVPDLNHFGCLHDDLLDITAQANQVSDDDIERCGYMGWISH